MTIKYIKLPKYACMPYILQVPLSISFSGGLGLKFFFPNRCGRCRSGTPFGNSSSSVTVPQNKAECRPQEPRCLEFPTNTISV